MKRLKNVCQVIIKHGQNYQFIRVKIVDFLINGLFPACTVFLHQSLWFLGLITEDQITVIQITEAKLLSGLLFLKGTPKNWKCIITIYFSSENWHFRYNLTFCNTVPNEKFSTLRKLHIIVYCQFLLIIFKITWLMERNWNKLKSIGGCL